MPSGLDPMNDFSPGGMGLGMAGPMGGGMGPIGMGLDMGPGMGLGPMGGMPTVPGMAAMMGMAPMGGEGAACVCIRLPVCRVLCPARPSHCRCVAAAAARSFWSVSVTTNLTVPFLPHFVCLQLLFVIVTFKQCLAQH